MPTPHEITAMRQAVALSALGLGTTSPNPPVGCVILDRHGDQVGAGFHRRKGEPHAEANALASAGSRAAGGTAVVTLEPCNHVGVTPACRQLLLDADVVRVVIAIIDPTSRGDGGAAVLKAAGVDVEVGVLANEAQAVLDPWLTATVRKRPWVVWLSSPLADIDDPVDLPAMRDLRQQTDIVVCPDGRIVEGIPGGHGEGRFHHPAKIDFTDPIASLNQLFAGGARTALIVGETAFARELLARGAIDRLSIDLPRANSDAHVTNHIRGLPFLGFRIEAVTTTPDSIRIAARLDTPRSGSDSDNSVEGG
ncbi:bifunctional diaminohydroxyphosphoribosylaminopyrimidine deaminase/5-amino-6-(5-phosphoribosylamino)uracil reductase RibD [Actinoplanes sp. NPDC049316]|uniref:bifunctional diaminohydroxyphosphoribosylaminopyrimidine deaminase/5-amino-6-(5-phosphoribosylamino)uracil reductase RibD n=1 Tax=Actinoplanes sp. NPDC049316 TaxID=3154727 RepID=UPI00341465EA